MIKFIAILLICILHTSTYAQQHNVSRRSFISISEALAFEIGKTYQRAQNCGQDLTNLSTITTTNLFLNYLTKNNVEIVMKQYEHSSLQQKGKSCNLEEINVQALIIKIGDYMRLAAPHIHHKQNDK